MKKRKSLVRKHQPMNQPGGKGITSLTDGRQVETERLEQAWLKGILETAMDAIITIDEQQRIVLFNAAAEKIFQYPIAEAMGKSIAQFIPKRFREAHREHVAEFGKRGKNARRMGQLGMVWGLRGHGEGFPLEASISRIEVYGKKFLTVILSDMTERLRTEEALKEVTLQQKLILQSAGEGIYGVDQKGIITFVNPATAKMVGHEVQELIGQSSHAMFHHSKPDGLPYAIQECPIHNTYTEGGIHFSCSHEVFWRKDGLSFPVEYTSTPIWNKEGSLNGAVVTFRNISERKRFQRALQTERSCLFAIMNTIGTLIVVLDLQGRIVQFNRACEDLTNYSFDEVKGKSLWEVGLISQKQMTAVKAVFQQLCDGHYPRSYENDWVGKDGTRHVIAWSNTVFIDESGKVKYVIGTGIDMTEKKKGEILLKRSKRRLERNHNTLRYLATKLITAQEDERRRIARDLHDDMNQQVAALALKIQTIQGQLSTESPLAKPLHELYQSVVSVSDDIHQLAYRLHPSILDDLGLAVAVRKYLDEFRAREPLDLFYQIKNLPGQIPLNVGTCLYRVMQEALRNVLKHSEAPSVTLTLEGTPGAIRLCVTDTGKGFDPHQLPADRSGIGLLGMKERIRLVGGRLKVNSRPGHGTEVCAQVPLAEKTA